MKGHLLNGAAPLARPAPGTEGGPSMQQEPNRRTPKRVRSKRYPGVYYRERPNGERQYLFGWRDSDGRWRTRNVAGGEQDAVAALEAEREKARRGASVKPTRMTFGEFSDEWLARQTHLRPKTREWYSIAIRVHLKPRLGKLRIDRVGDNDIARLIEEMRATKKAAWTIRGALTPLGLILDDAERRRLIGANPMRRLRRGARPRVGRPELRILTSDEIGQVIARAPESYRVAIATAIFTGMRLGELLGLRWSDVDFDGHVIRVERQVDRHGVPAEPKTPQAKRTIVLMPALAAMLREHRVGSRFSRKGDFVFVSRKGTPMQHRNLAQRGLAKALEATGLGDYVDDGRGGRKFRAGFRFHDLRHTFASLLIAQGANVVFVSRQLGHASPDITLRVYAHLFDQAEHAQRARDALEASFGKMLAAPAADGGAEVVELAPAKAGGES
jgi:integrase